MQCESVKLFITVLVYSLLLANTIYRSGFFCCAAVCVTLTLYLYMYVRFIEIKNRNMLLLLRFLASVLSCCVLFLF